ncbi:hypothetical protein RI367_000727 [Sorochytrium milnesiophthora]
MVRAAQPELKKYMDKKVAVQLNAGRKVSGMLRGYDPFMNIVLDNTIEELPNGEQRNIGSAVFRGNSIVMIEAHDRVG